MTKSLVPLGTKSHMDLAQRIHRAWPTPKLSQAAGGVSRTILITRGEAGADQIDACVAAFMLCLSGDGQTFLAHVGGPAGSAYRSHPDNFRKRYETIDEDFVAKLCDWRCREAGEDHCVIIFDPQLNPRVPECIKIWENAYAIPFPVDLIYVAVAGETRMAAARKFADLGLSPIISQCTSIFCEPDTSRLDFPRLPPDLKARLDEDKSSPFADLLDQTSPATRAVYVEQAEKFAQRFEEISRER